jgi:hypothetical protein
MQLLGLSTLRTAVVTVFLQSGVISAHTLSKVVFLVEAAVRNATAKTVWSDGLIAVLNQLEERDRDEQGMERNS